MSKARTLADAVAAGGAMRLAELATNGTNTVGLSAPNALAADVTWKLPSADGTNGQALVTDGAGNLSWGAGGGGTPGGSNTQIQFNNSGAFGGSANLTWDGTNVQVGATGAVRFADTDSSNYVALKAPGTVSANVTWTLPATDGTSGQVLTTNGSGALAWGSSSGGGLSWQSVQTTGFTAVAGRGYPCNTTSAAFTVTLPASPSAGDIVTLADYAGTWNTNNLTINPNGNKLNGATTNGVLTTQRGAANLVYVDATQGWISYASNLSTLIEQPTTSVRYLLVGGGGGGGSEVAGGGGAGGFLTDTAFPVTPGTSYSITVGTPGSGGASGAPNNGTAGGDSIFSTITAKGGGYGAKGGGGAENGGPGGSGGGAGSFLAKSGGTATVSPSQGNNGGSSTAYTSGPVASGGGGGAKNTSPVGTGGNGTNTGPAGGAGGAGRDSDITGSTVTYAGGGGGIGYDFNSNTGTGASGGAGGGGNGGSHTVAAGAGGTNLGGGGGGGSGGQRAGGNGGSGVVIISYPLTFKAATTTGSPTYTESGGNRIYKFTGNGSITF